MDEFKVLVVDDEDDFRETLIKRLRNRKLQADGVASGYQALEKLRQTPMDIVILDVKMPGLDGIATLKEIKARYPEIEVIMLTGHASVESGIQGMQLGAFDYVMKPVPLDELLDKMRQAYERKKLRSGQRAD